MSTHNKDNHRGPIPKTKNINNLNAKMGDLVPTPIQTELFHIEKQIVSQSN